MHYIRFVQSLLNGDAMPDDLDPEKRFPHLPEEDPVESAADSEVEVTDEQFKPGNRAWRDLRSSGVGGWLMFFIVTLVFISPLRICASLGQYDSAWEPLYATYPLLKTIKLITVVVGLGLICFSVYAGFSLWKVRPNAVRTAKTYLLVLATSSITLSCLPLFVGLPEQANTAILQVLPVEILIMLVYPTVWYLYLNKSKRVAITYGLVL